jgi:hypothetical protein
MAPAGNARDARVREPAGPQRGDALEDARRVAGARVLVFERSGDAEACRRAHAVVEVQQQLAALHVLDLVADLDVLASARERASDRVDARRARPCQPLDEDLAARGLPPRPVGEGHHVVDHHAPRDALAEVSPERPRGVKAILE